MAISDTQQVVEALRDTLRDGIAAAITALGFGSGDYSLTDPGSTAWRTGPLLIDPGIDPLFWIEPISARSVVDGSGSPITRHVEHVLRVVAAVLVPDGDEQSGWLKAAKWIDCFTYSLSITTHLGLTAGDFASGIDVRWRLADGEAGLYYNGVMDVAFTRVWRGN